MKELSDEELQEMIEHLTGSGSSEFNNQKPVSSFRDETLSTANDADARAYRILFEVLGKEPDIPMTHNFAGKVTASLQARKNHLADIKLWIVIGLCIALFILAGFLYLASNNAINGSLFILSIIKYKWTIFFGLTSVFVIQFLDKKLIARERAGV